MRDAEVIYGMPESEYHAIDRMSASQLKTAATQSLEKLKEYRDGQAEDKKELRIGTFCHMRVNSPSDWANVVYEPRDLIDGIETAPGVKATKPRATKEYKRRKAEWLAANQGKTIITPADYEVVDGCYHALINSPCYQLPSACEIVVLFTWQGIACKARIDAELKLAPNLYSIFDWKFMEGTVDFGNKIMRYGYHMQMAFYREAYLEAGRGVSDCILAAVDKETRSPGYTVCAPMSRRLLALGLAECQHWLHEVQQAELLDVWPGPPPRPEGIESPDEWDIPRWYHSPVALPLVDAVPSPTTEAVLTS